MCDQVTILPCSLPFHTSSIEDSGNNLPQTWKAQNDTSSETSQKWISLINFALSFRPDRRI